MKVKHFLRWYGVVFFILLQFTGIAQRFDSRSPEIGHRFSALGRYMKTDNIYEVFYPSDIYATTPHEDTYIHLLGGAYTFRLGMPQSNLFFDIGVSISSYNRALQTHNEGGHFYLSNDNGLEYTMLLDYNELGINGGTGYMILVNKNGPPYFWVYPRIGFNFAILTEPIIKYKSNDPLTDPPIEKAINEHNHFRNDFQLHTGIGFQVEMTENLAIELEYNYMYGFTDVIETSDNQFFWRDDAGNKQSGHQLGLSILIQFNP